MTPQEVLDQFRRESGDDVAPYLWGDDEALRYLRQAQDDLVKQVGGIADVTVALADIGSPQTRLQDLDLAASSPYTAVSPYILRIRSGRLLTAARDVTFIQESDLDKTLRTDYGRTVGLSLDDTLTGNVDFGVLGIRENYVRWLDVPASTDTCRLNVFRLPYPRITGWNPATEGSLEIAEDLHMGLVDGMRARAYLKADSETYDKAQADRFAALFQAVKDGARKDYDKRRFRKRMVSYGGL